MKAGRWINWKNPMTFNEKLKWLILYDRKKEYTTIVDKIKFKEWVAKKISNEFIIPTIGIWDRVEDIDFSTLPEKFVLKANHISGGSYIHRTSQKPDRDHIIKITKQEFNQNYFKRNGEWPYKKVKRKIFAEEYITDHSEKGMPDYKFYCFNGDPRYIQINSFRDHYYFNEEKKISDYQLFYNDKWELQEFIQGYPGKGDFESPKPKNFEKMIEIARILSERIPFVRVDQYNIDGKIYVGELTFYPYGIFGKFDPPEWDLKLGKLLDIRK
ncbi:MAG: glycosyl transferase [Muribaculaceae bacterium]|nr:glycosyl transferase [Muribaculaceae bacterium]